LSVNRFFVFIFEEQFLDRHSLALQLVSISNKAGHHTHLSLFGNPFFKLFSFK